LAIAYLKAVFVKQEAQWQLVFMFVPIPILLGFVALFVAYGSRANRTLIGACVTAIALPCVLLFLVKSHVY
jgi:hypothetical protein